MASPCSTSTDLRRLAAGRNSRPPPLTILLDLRWPDDLQLYPDQPIPDLSAPLPSSLSGWLEAAMLFGRAFERALAAYFLHQDAAAALFQQWKPYRSEERRVG